MMFKLIRREAEMQFKGSFLSVNSEFDQERKGN